MIQGVKGVSSFFSLPLQDYKNVAEVTFNLTFMATDINIPFLESPLCHRADSQVTNGSIPFHEVPITQDLESGQYYIQVVSVLCWSIDRVSIPYQLIINDITQPSGNVS